MIYHIIIFNLLIYGIVFTIMLYLILLNGQYSSLNHNTQDYEQTSTGGSVRRVTDGGTEIDLGDTFSRKG